MNISKKEDPKELIAQKERLLGERKKREKIIQTDQLHLNENDPDTSQNLDIDFLLRGIIPTLTDSEGEFSRESSYLRNWNKLPQKRDSYKKAVDNSDEFHKVIIESTLTPEKMKTKKKPNFPTMAYDISDLEQILDEKIESDQEDLNVSNNTHDFAWPKIDQLAGTITYTCTKCGYSYTIANPDLIPSPTNSKYTRIRK